MTGIVTHPGVESPSTTCNLPTSGSEWVELIVQEMSKASNMDDARARTCRVLEGLENSISARTSAEAAQNLQKVSSCLTVVALIVYFHLVADLAKFELFEI